MTGKDIRLFFRGLMGSRVAETLELENMRQRQIYEHRLQERDGQISELREERDRLRAKFDEYEADPTYFWWLSQRAATRARIDKPPVFEQDTEPPTSSSWQAVQADWYRKQAEEAAKEKNNGVSEQGRTEV